MNENHRDLISIAFTVCVVAMTVFVAHRFIVPLMWAGIIAIATWPIYLWLESLLGKRRTVVASLLTAFITLVVALPLLWLTVIVVQEAHVFVNFLIQANQQGIPAPDWLDSLPKVGHYFSVSWQKWLGTAQGIEHLLADGHASVKTLSDFLKVVGLQVAHRSVIFGFAIACLFFFYRDGARLAEQIDAIGHYCLTDRWQMYAHQLPGAIIATVNGVVLVGITVGVIMGVIYGVLGVPLAALFGAFTAILAMIPFGAPIVFVFAALILTIKSQFVAALVLLIVGTVVMFIADHFVRPLLIGGATRIHFLAVLFGILGGVETFGVVGLFIGPAVMVLFTTLWHEPELAHNER